MPNIEQYPLELNQKHSDLNHHQELDQKYSDKKNGDLVVIPEVKKNGDLIVIPEVLEMEYMVEPMGTESEPVGAVYLLER